MSENGTTDDLRERIKQSAGKRKRSEPYEIPEWGETVELRPLTVGGKFSIFGEDATMNEEGEADLKMKDLGSMLPQVIIGTCYDPASGERIWTDEDLEWLADQDADVVEPLATAGMRISGLTKETADEGKGGSS